MELKFDDLRISNRKPALLKSKPFPFFCWDGFLPHKIYEELYNSWPNESYYGDSIFGGKKGFQKREHAKVKDFFSHYPIWKKFIGIIESQEFISDVQKFVRPLQYPHRPITSLRKWIISDSKKSFFEKLLVNEVDIDWELSMYGENNFLDPHTDRMTKYVSLLLYFPHPEWKDQYGGGTIMYSPKDKKYNQNWSNNYIALNNMNEAHNFSYNANKLVGFIKTSNSWHGVEPIRQPSGMNRKALAINIGIPEHKHLKLTNRAVESFYRRKEAHLYKDINVLNTPNTIKK